MKIDWEEEQVKRSKVIGYVFIAVMVGLAMVLIVMLSSGNAHSETVSIETIHKTVVGIWSY